MKDWIVDKKFIKYAKEKAYIAGHALNQPLKCVVIHYTAGGSTEGALRTLTETFIDKKRVDASAHFVLGRDGVTWQLVPLSERSKHAGNGSIDGVRNLNPVSIGIELVNWGVLTPRKDAQGVVTHYESYVGTKVNKEDAVEAAGQFWHKFPDVQIKALDKLLTDLEAEGVPMRLTGHADVAPKVKVDPGAAFPWSQILTGKRHKNP